MRLRAGAATDVGRVRSLNEDSFVSNADQGLFAVCDGMGGAAAGEVASRIAIDTIVEQLAGAAGEHGASDAAEDPGYLPQTSRLGRAIQHANESVYSFAQGDRERQGMGTTVVGIWIADDIVSVAHVGDSRAYLWHEGTFEALTTDHSVVEAQVRAGLITREESLKSEHQNVLLQALGMKEAVDVELSEVPVQTGDFVMLCSDGLTRTVEEDQMANIIAASREPQAICEQLIAAANASGGPDNVTVIVVEIVGSLWGRLSNRLKGR